MATLYMIHGFVGVGKTTFSKKLADELNIVRFTLDEWFIGIFGQNPPQGTFAQYEENIKELIWDISKKILSKGNDVILDFGFWKKLEREKYKARARELGVEVKLYNIVCPENIFTKRVLERTNKMEEGALFIDQNAINEFKARFEPVGIDENAILIDNS